MGHIIPFWDSKISFQGSLSIGDEAGSDGPWWESEEVQARLTRLNDLQQRMGTIRLIKDSRGKFAVEQFRQLSRRLRIMEEPERTERSEFIRKLESIDYGCTEEDEKSQESSFILEEPRITMK